MGSVPPFSTLASASLDRESRRIQHHRLTLVPCLPTLISDRPTPKKVICAKNKESPAGLPSRARVLPTVDYDRPLATTSQTTSKNVRPLTLSSKIPVIRDARPPISDNSYTKRPIRTPHPPTARAMSPEAQLEEICDQMQALDIQASAFRQINIDLWDNDITHDEKDKIAVTTYVAKMDRRHMGPRPNEYKSPQKLLRKEVSTQVHKGNATQFLILQTIENPQTWPEQEFTEMVFDERTAAFRRQTALLGSNASTNPHPSQPPSPSVTPLAAPHQEPDLVNPSPTPSRTLIRPCNLWRIHETPRITSRTLSSIATSNKFMKTWNKDRNYRRALRLFLSNCSHIQVKPPRFYLDKITWATTFRQAYDIFKQHFDTKSTICFEDPTKCFKSSLISFSSANEPLAEYAGDLQLRTTLMKACRGVPELQYALFKPADNVEHLLADLRASVETHLALITTSQFPLTLLDHLIITIHTISTTSTVDTITTALEVDTDIQVNDPAADTDKATTKAVGQLNTLRMNGKGQDQHITQCHFIGVQLTDIGGYILDYEGHEMSSFDDTEDTWEEHDNSTNDHPEQWQASQMLCQQAFNHLITGEDVYQTDQTVVPASQFIIEDRYSRIDSKQHFPQQDTLKDPSVALDSSTSGQASIKFGNSDAIHSLGTDHVPRPSNPNSFCSALLIWTGLTPSIVLIIVLIAYKHSSRTQMGTSWFFLTKDEESISFLTETEIPSRAHPTPLQEHHNPLFYTLWTQLLLSRSQIFTVNTLRTLWIDTYLGPPDTLLPVETHWSIGKIERYHAPSDAPLTSSMLRLATPLPPKQSFKWLLKQSMIRQDLTVLCLPRQKCYPSRCKVKFAFGEKTIASIDTHNITIDTVNGPKSFDRPLYNRICVMIPLFPTLHDTDPQSFVQILMNNRLKTPGRPPGSKNKPKDLIMMAQTVDQSFLTQRRKMHSSFLKLRSDGIITSLVTPSKNPITKITDLVGRGVFQFERYDQMIKGINTKPYEKSRLVIQDITTLRDHPPDAISDNSTRIPAIPDQAFPDHSYMLPTELQGKYLTEQLFVLLSPCTFRTYQQHHLEKLDMSTSTYDSCLLISNTGLTRSVLLECKLMTPSSLERTTFLPVKKKSYKRQNFVPSPRLTSHTEQRLTLMVQD
ncbi:hypothetical protein HRG_014241 [Hirsutella rhossiliensis]